MYTNVITFFNESFKKMLFRMIFAVHTGDSLSIDIHTSKIWKVLCLLQILQHRPPLIHDIRFSIA